MQNEARTCRVSTFQSEPSLYKNVSDTESIYGGLTSSFLSICHQISDSLLGHEASKTISIEAAHCYYQLKERLLYLKTIPTVIYHIHCDSDTPDDLS